jgi:tetratricopeptide (TPR) repeat protein
LRSLARAGLLAPRRGPIGPLSFGFHELRLLRTTKALLQSGVPMRRIRRVWASLREQLPADATLSGITFDADGDEVIVSDGGARWKPDSGQILLDFDEAAPADANAAVGQAAVATGSVTAPGLGHKPDAPPRPRLALVKGTGTSRGHPHAPGRAPAESESEMTAEECYEAGCALEATAPEEAREAYERALDLDPYIVDAHVNLGRQLHVAGELGRAEYHYREAARIDPNDPTPHFNLGVLLEELRRRDEAVHAYRQAIVRDSEFADAHHNLALLLETLGRRQEAVRHLIAARQLSGSAD